MRETVTTRLLKVLPWAILAAVLAFALAPRADAQAVTTTKVQGLVQNGTATVDSVNPVLIAVSDGTNVRTARGNATGIFVQGGTADGTAAGNGDVVAGSDNGGLTRTMQVGRSGLDATGTNPRTLVVGGSDGVNVRVLPLVVNGGNVANTFSVPIGGVDGGTLGRTVNVTRTGSTLGATPSALLIAGSDGTNAQAQTIVPQASAVSATAPMQVIAYVDSASNAKTLTVSSNGLLANEDSHRITYTAIINAPVTVATTPTDVITLTGGPKLVTPRQLTINCQRTVAGFAYMNLLRRSTVDSGGTFVSLTPTPLDSVFAAATATVGYYTANPTTGSSAGTFNTTWINVGTTGTIANFVFINSAGSPTSWPVLRGTSEQLAFNLAGQTITGLQINSMILTWTEE